MKPLYIEAVSLLLQEVSEADTELKKELENTAGQKFRRVNHFVLLALAGVFRLPNLFTVDPKCALYVGTANGCVRDVVKMLEQMYRDTLLPMPFTFMGTSTTMAGFHIGATLGLSGSNVTVSNPYGSFEQALGMACTQLESGTSTSALVGCVDEGVLPLDEFKKVTHNDDEVVFEGGGWLKLSLACANPLAVIIARESFKTLAAVEEYCEQESLNEHLTVIRNRESSYIGSSGGVDYIQALQEQRSGRIALVSQTGLMSFSVTLTRILG